MTTYYVYRRGYNAANNSCLGGGPETVRVFECEAASEKAAVEQAIAAGVSCYNNQLIWAEDANKVEARRPAGVLVEYWRGTTKLTGRATTYAGARRIAARNQNAWDPSFFLGDRDGEELFDDGNSLVPNDGKVVL